MISYRHLYSFQSSTGSFIFADFSISFTNFTKELIINTIMADTEQSVSESISELRNDTNTKSSSGNFLKRNQIFSAFFYNFIAVKLLSNIFNIINPFPNLKLFYVQDPLLPIRCIAFPLYVQRLFEALNSPRVLSEREDSALLGSFCLFGKFLPSHFIRI